MTDAGGDGEGRATPAVLLVDDHEVVRQGLRLLLESVLGFTVREAGDAVRALASIEEDRPDVVLLDARMPERDGIWTLKAIRAEHTDLPVIMLSTYDSEEYVEPALEHGAVGYLLKDASADQLREAIETATDGAGTYLHPAVAQRLFARRGEHTGPGGPLSERELDILRLLVEGARNEEIAQQLHLAEATVKSHLTSVFRKLGVSNRTQAVAKALHDGIVGG